MTPWTLDTLSPLPRLGWVNDAVPVTPLPEQAAELGLHWLGVKRDDQLEPLGGGTKTRKLDYLLAAEPFASAPRWASVGAIGSGHLAAMTMAAKALDRTLDAHCFFEPLGPSVLENLACIASGPTRLFYRSNRVTLGLRSPGVVLGRPKGAVPSVPPGGSVPAGVVGVIAGGLELAGQIHRGDLPRPDVVFVPWGTGGTAVGIALGLALAGLPTPVRAVATVEPWFVSRRVLRRLADGALRWLERAGIPAPAGFDPPLPEGVRGHVGRGYGHPTEASEDACRWIGAGGVAAEPIYGGKALSALRQEALGLRGQTVLYWLTSHGGGLPSEPDWAERLPPGLRRRLRRGTGPSRRRLLVGGAALLGATALRHGVGYDRFEGWSGLVLDRREAQVLAAAAEAIVPDVPGPLPVDGPSARELVSAVDRYLAGMPATMIIELHGMFELLEQGTLLGGRISRLTSLEPDARRGFLLRLESFGGLLAQASRGVRDLCLLGWYQDARTWAPLGYRGPWVPAAGLGGPGRYSSLVAPAGREPWGVRPGAGTGGR